MPEKNESLEEVIIFHEPPTGRGPRQGRPGWAPNLKIIIRTFPNEAPNEFTDRTIWIGKNFNEGVSEHVESRSGLCCYCEDCTRKHHHLKTREDVAAEKRPHQA